MRNRTTTSECLTSTLLAVPNTNRSTDKHICLPVVCRLVAGSVILAEPDKMRRGVQAGVTAFDGCNGAIDKMLACVRHDPQQQHESKRGQLQLDAMVKS